MMPRATHYYIYEYSNPHSRRYRLEVVPITEETTEVVNRRLTNEKSVVVTLGVAEGRAGKKRPKPIQW